MAGLLDVLAGLGDAVGDYTQKHNAKMEYQQSLADAATQRQHQSTEWDNYLQQMHEHSMEQADLNKTFGETVPGMTQDNPLYYQTHRHYQDFVIAQQAAEYQKQQTMQNMKMKDIDSSVPDIYQDMTLQQFQQFNNIHDQINKATWEDTQRGWLVDQHATEMKQQKKGQELIRSTIPELSPNSPYYNATWDDYDKVRAVIDGQSAEDAVKLNRQINRVRLQSEQNTLAAQPSSALTRQATELGLQEQISDAQALDIPVTWNVPGTWDPTLGNNGGFTPDTVIHATPRDVARMPKNSGITRMFANSTAPMITPSGQGGFQRIVPIPANAPLGTNGTPVQASPPQGGAVPVQSPSMPPVMPVPGVDPGTAGPVNIAELPPVTPSGAAWLGIAPPSPTVTAPSMSAQLGIPDARLNFPMSDMGRQFLGVDKPLPRLPGTVGPGRLQPSMFPSAMPDATTPTPAAPTTPGAQPITPTTATPGAPKMTFTDWYLKNYPPASGTSRPDIYAKIDNAQNNSVVQSAYLKYLTGDAGGKTSVASRKLSLQTNFAIPPSVWVTEQYRLHNPITLQSIEDAADQYSDNGSHSGTENDQKAEWQQEAGDYITPTHPHAPSLPIAKAAGMSADAFINTMMHGHTAGVSELIPQASIDYMTKIDNIPNSAVPAGMTKQQFAGAVEESAYNHNKFATAQIASKEKQSFSEWEQKWNNNYKTQVNTYNESLRRLKYISGKYLSAKEVNSQNAALDRMIEAVRVHAGRAKGLDVDITADTQEITRLQQQKEDNLKLLDPSSPVTPVVTKPAPPQVMPAPKKGGLDIQALLNPAPKTEGGKWWAAHKGDGTYADVAGKLARAGKNVAYIQNAMMDGAQIPSDDAYNTAVAAVNKFGRGASGARPVTGNFAPLPTNVPNPAGKVSGEGTAKPAAGKSTLLLPEWQSAIKQSVKLNGREKAIGKLRVKFSQQEIDAAMKAAGA